MKNLEFISNKTLGGLSLAIFAINNEHQVIYWNKACEQLTGVSSEEVIGTNEHWKAFYLTERPCLVDFIVGGNSEKINDFYEFINIGTDNSSLKCESWIATQDKNLKYLSIDASPLYDADNNKIGAIALLTNLTPYKNINDKLKMSYDVFDDVSDGVVVTNEENKIIFVNKAVEQMSKFTKDELLGNTPAIFSMKNQDRSFVKDLWDSLNHKGHWRGEFMNMTKDKLPYHVRYNITKFLSETGEVNHFALLSNITEQKNLLEQLSVRANYDHLTKLPNRAMLEQKLESLIECAKVENSKFAVIFLDLDKFKSVNDTFGHDVGDALLKEIGTRLKTIIGSGDMAARLGGDEFVIALEKIEDEYDVELVINKIKQAFSEQFEIKSHMLSISSSIGVAIYPDAGTNLEDLLKNADTSMYWSKACSNGTSSSFNENMNSILKENMEIIDKLKTNIHNNLQIYLQPQYSLIKDRIYGAEALIRWNDRDLGWISPDRFIPLAEKFGLVDQIWDFMLDNSCRLIKESGVKIAVNLSASQLMQPELVNNVKNYLNKYNLNPSLLSFEITETILISNFDIAKEVLEKFSSMGISLALDDFGTGYSSLGYLNQLPFDYIKIDKSFIKDPNNKSIADSIIEMAQKLNLATIAEGVENIEQVLRVKNSGCSIMQGYFYSKPLKEQEFLEFINGNKSSQVKEEIGEALFEKAKEIDEAGKDRCNELIIELNRIENSEAKNDMPIQIEDVISVYNNLMIYFFEKEEVMLKKGFIDYEKYRQENEEFLSTLLTNIADVNDNNKSPKPLIGFIRRWLTSNCVITNSKLKNLEDNTII